MATRADSVEFCLRNTHIFPGHSGMQNDLQINKNMIYK